MCASRVEPLAVLRRAARTRWAILACVGMFIRPVIAAETPVVSFRAEKGRVEVSVGGKAVGTYVYRDAKIPRPYFAHVRGPGGVPLTRNHPPVAGRDATDHATYHPGIWMAFGDISGADFWRNRATVVHESFVEAPRGGPGRGAFVVRNRYVAGDGARTVCFETCRFSLHVRPSGYLLIWDSTFTSPDADFTFGDQEEMGLGIRVATPLTVQRGGHITNSDGGIDEKQVWGRQANWCDYGGTVEGRRVGITLMPDPKNFRRSWYHARDYGLLLANPFGRAAFHAGPKSAVTVQRGETLRLRFGLLLYDRPADTPFDPADGYRDFLRQVAADE